MVRASSSSKPATTAVASASATTAPVVVAEKKASATPAKKASASAPKKEASAPAPKKEVSAPAPAPVAPVVASSETAPADASTPAVVAPVKASVEIPTTEQLLIIRSRINDRNKNVNALLSENDKDEKLYGKLMEKKDKFDVKNSSKKVKKVKAKKVAGEVSNKKSGFNKPVAITDEFADFLNIPRGTLISRVDVNRIVRDYINTNNLRDPTNGQKIIPNEAFAKLLRYENASAVEDKDKLSYFNLQRWMKPLFVKAEIVVV